MTPHANIPFGLCHCGCGEKATLATKTSTRDRTVKGQPVRFLPSHHMRTWSGPKYVVEDRGYETPCWIWQGKLNSSGYGPHVREWEKVNGPVPAGRQLDHLCRVRVCINIDHMEPVTPRENTLRSANPEITRQRHAVITHCPQGHEYTPENTRLKQRKSGANRICRACNREYMRKKRATAA